jgi:energy-coupling factor transport system permease protein
LVVVALLAIGVGAYGLLDATSPGYLGAPMLIAGVVVGALGFRLAGRGVTRTRYRPERWAGAELQLALGGIACAALTIASDLAARYPNPNPLSWPSIPLLAFLGIFLAGVTAIAPTPAVRLA